MCALKLSKMSKEVLLKKDMGLGRHTFSPETAIPSLSIHPSFVLAVDNYNSWKVFFGHCFSFEDDRRFQLFASLWTREYNSEACFLVTGRWHSNALSSGWINSCAIRRMKGHWHFIHVENTICQWMLSSSFLYETNWRKVVTCSSQSLGSLWPTVVLEHTERLLISLHESSSCLITNVLHFWALTSRTERTVTTGLALFPWALIVCL